MLILCVGAAIKPVVIWGEHVEDNDLNRGTNKKLHADDICTMLYNGRWTTYCISEDARGQWSATNKTLQQGVIFAETVA